MLFAHRSQAVGVHGAPGSDGFRPKRLSEDSKADIRGVLKMPDVQAAFAKQGIEVTGTAPEQMAEVIRSELARWGKVIMEARIKAE